MNRPNKPGVTYTVTPDRATPEHVATELQAILLRSFHRKDQRTKAERYLFGLLTAHGRKSVRNIAAQVGRNVTEQSLHHFISSSTWDWRPLRSALATYLEQVRPPHAWVLQSMHIPKTGDHSVGVDSHFDPRAGQALRGQHAFGVWGASQEISAPVNWRLFLPEPWIHDRKRRRQAAVPDNAGHESLDECAVSAVLGTALLGKAPRRPVVLDLPGGSTLPAMQRFLGASVPVLGRVGASTRFQVADRTMPGHGAGPLPAGQILESMKGLRRPVHWRDPAGQGAARTSLASIVRVTSDHAARWPLLLIGEWLAPARSPVAVWLTDIRGESVGSLLRMTKLPERVRHDFAGVGGQVGLRDYVGRSFHGWHRHMTLASAAHTIAVLAPGSVPARYHELMSA
ncbi:transposase [Streptomyces sp. NPDC095613]|uniref:IS701 family transposase n=1 Tax=Streptomyces sp. NPDC095613 TaxID=3155540 RepID=UPI0033188D0D